MLTQDEFKRCLPKQMTKVVNQQLIDSINATLTDPNMVEILRDNILGYTGVLNMGRFKMASYIDAVKYVSYKVMGDTNIAAYSKTFPDRYRAFVLSGTSDKDIASYITAYNKNKLVNLILEQTLIPTHILNADVFQKAINVQKSIMLDTDASFKVRSDAANSLMTHLKRPEAVKTELDIAIKDDGVIASLAQAVHKLSEQQRSIIGSGSQSAKEIAHTGLIIDHETGE